MAIVIGAQTSRQQVDQSLINVSHTGFMFFRMIEDLAQWKLRTPDEVLTLAIADGGKYGYTTEEAYAVQALIDRWNAYRLAIQNGPPVTEQHDLWTDTAAAGGLGTAG